MFYCEDCKEKNKYPESIRVSYGRCEICGETAECYDVPSSHLPKEPLKKNIQVEDDYAEELIDLMEFISNMKILSHKQQVNVLAKIAEDLTLNVTAEAIRESINK